MTVEHIFTCPPNGGPQAEHASIDVVAGAGLVGDRYFDQHDEPGQNVTFIEAEQIEAFAREHGREPDLSVTRRNVITCGIRLNDLVGREFSVGGLRFRGVELCEPCASLGAALASPTLSAAGVIRFFVHKGGLRADVLSGRRLAVGASFKTA